MSAPRAKFHEDEVSAVPYPKAKKGASVKPPSGARTVRDGEVVLGYVHAPPKPRRPGAGSSLVMNKRVHEIERIIAGRPGGVIHDGDGLVIRDAPEIIEVAIHTVAAARRAHHATYSCFADFGDRDRDEELRRYLLRWAEQWFVMDEAVRFEIECAVREIKRFSARKAGIAVGLTPEERTRNKIETIRAAGETAATMATRRAAQKRERDRKRTEVKRRQAGVPKRGESENARIMRAYEIPRRTFYRWKKEGQLEARMAEIDAARKEGVVQQGSFPPSASMTSGTKKSPPSRPRKLVRDLSVPLPRIAPPSVALGATAQRLGEAVSRLLDFRLIVIVKDGETVARQRPRRAA